MLLHYLLKLDHKIKHLLLSDCKKIRQGNSQICFKYHLATFFTCLIGNGTVVF